MSERESNADDDSLTAASRGGNMAAYVHCSGLLDSLHECCMGLSMCAIGERMEKCGAMLSCLFANLVCLL